MIEAPLVEEYAMIEAEKREQEESRQKFIQWLQQEEQRARNPELQAERDVAIGFYNGAKLGNEVEGRSQAMTRDVAEAVDYMITSILRTMVSGERVVEFEGVSQEDKEMLEQATEAVMQQFMRNQNGYAILHDSLKAGLIEKTGVIKSYVVAEKKKHTEQMTAIELVMMAEAGAEIASVDIISEEVDPETQEISELVEAVFYTQQPKFCDETVPNEEFLVSRDARRLDEAVYQAHVVRTTLSEIQKMGFDAEDIRGEGYDDSFYDTENARDSNHSDTLNYRDGANQQVWLREAFVLYDLDEDGIAELLRVQYAGNVILEVEEVEERTIDEWCPFPMPHRRVGQSLADKTMDIQAISATLLRAALDNLYLANQPRIWVDENGIGENTIDDMLDPGIGGLVRTKGGIKPEAFTVPDMTGGTLMLLDRMRGEKESRTGITRLNQGLDADAISKTATGTAMMQAQGQQMEEYIARNFAEFIGRVFRKKYRLMREYGEPFLVEIDGKPQMVDPAAWPEEMRVSVKVGLGSGRKNERIQDAMLLLNIQKEARMGGIAVTDEHIYNTVNAIVRDIQFGQATDYFPGPDDGQMEEKMSPEEMEAQGKLQIEQMKLQGDQAKTAAQIELERQKVGANIQLTSEKHQMEIQQKREKAELELELARDKAISEEEMALRRQAFEMSRVSQQDSLKKYRDGGRLDA